MHKRHGKKAPEFLQDAGSGDGPVDAALKTIDRLTKTRGKLMDYALRAVSAGEDALGLVTVKLDFGDGKLISGNGASTDVIEAAPAPTPTPSTATSATATPTWHPRSSPEPTFRPRPSFSPSSSRSTPLSLSAEQPDAATASACQTCEDADPMPDYENVLTG